MQVRFKLLGRALKLLEYLPETLRFAMKQKVIGEVDLEVEYEDGRKEKRHFRNTVLMNGRSALARCLANDVDDEFNFYVDQMVFGNGGTSEGIPKYVQAERNSLFGMKVVARPVIATVSRTDRNVVTFTAVIAKNDPYVGVLNEMALHMANDNLYSMVTFPDLTKTSQMQLTWTWTLTFV